MIENDKEHLDDYIRKFAVSIREMHKIEVDPVQFPSVKAESLQMVPLLEGFCTEEEIEKLLKLFEIIPDRSTFIHGDCHPGNVMTQNGELVFIDMLTCGSGHPIFDLASILWINELPGINCPSVISLTTIDSPFVFTI